MRGLSRFFGHREEILENEKRHFKYVAAVLKKLNNMSGGLSLANSGHEPV
jgi:hypothetical protein